MVTLDKKALGKALTREVFESILAEIQTTLKEPSFKEKNKLNQAVKIGVKRLQTTYHNLKRKMEKKLTKKKMAPEWLEKTIQTGSK